MNLSFMIRAGAGYSSYLWNTAATTLTITVTDGAYTATVTDAGGCTASASITITANPTPTVTVSSPATICIGNAAILTASGANTYSWSPSTMLSSTTGAVVTANPTTTITYTVTGTDANGCTNSASVTVTVNPATAPVADAGPDVEVVEPVSCNDTVTTTIGTPLIVGNTYLWTAIPVAAIGAVDFTNIPQPSLNYDYSFTGTHSATYIITVTDQSTNCMNSDALIASFVACRIGHFDTSSVIPLGRNIEVFPNPANIFVNVTVELYENEKVLFEIYDLLDRKISETELTTDINQKAVNVAEIKNNLYFYKISINGTIIKADKLLIIR